MSTHTQKDPTPEDEARPEIYDERLAATGPQGIDSDPQVLSARAVTAIIVTHGRRRFLDRTLAALAEQVTLPNRVVLVDAGAETTEILTEVFDGALVDVDLVTVRATGIKTFGAGVQAAVEHLEQIDPAADNSLRWFWLLHDDSAPEPDALLELLRAVEHNASVAIAGAKQRDWFAPERLLEVGLTTSPAGRRMTGIEAGEVDQGQHDGREDVLGVGLAGAIFRADVWNDLGGTDPEYGLFGDGLEISRRARLAGFRVIVAPSAVVLHAQGALNPRAGRHTTVSAGETAAEPTPMSAAAAWGATRRSTLFYRLVGASPWTLPLHVLAMVLFIPLRMLWQLAAKQTGRVRHELTTVAWAAFRPLPLRRSRVRFRTTTVLPRRTLIPLRASWRDVLAERLHVRLARAELRRTLVTPDPLDRAERRRTRVRGAGNLGLVALGLAGLSVWWFGGVSGLIGSGGRLVSPSLPLAEGSGPGLWTTITNGWNSSGFGSPTPTDPLWSALTPLAFLSPSGLQTLVHALIIGSLLIGGVGAWFAAGVGTRSLALRAWVAFAWIALPTAALAVSEGRLGTLLAHIALPWVVLGTLRGVGLTRPAPTVHAEPNGQPAPNEQTSPNEGGAAKKSTDSAQIGASLRRQPGSIPAAAGAGLALALAVGGAPAFLVPVALVLVLLALTIRRGSPRAGNRRYLWLVLIPSLLIVLPLVRQVTRLGIDRFWPILLGAPGPAVPGVPAEGWVQLLGWPIAPSTWSTADGVLGHVLNAAPFALGGLIILVAVGALLSGRAAGVPVRVAWLAATLALASAFAVGLVLVGQGAEVVHGWSGPFLSLAYVGFLVAFVLALDAAPGWTAAHSFGWRQTGLVLVSILAVVVVGGTIAQTIRTNDLITSDRVGLQVLAEPVVPAVGQQMQDPPRQSRVLALGAGAETTFQVLRTDGPQAVDASAVLAGRALLDPVVDPVPDGASSTPAEGGASVNDPDEILAHVVAKLVGGVDAGPDEMVELGIGSVLLTPQGSEEDRIRISNRLDTLSSLERIAESESGIIWRVAVTSEPDEDDATGGTPSQGSDQEDPATGTLEAQAAWARSVPDTEDATERSAAELGTAVPSSGLGIRTTIEPSPEMRHLVLAERADTGWQATLNGTQMRTLDVDWRQTFELGNDGGDLHVWYEMPGTSGWRIALIAVGIIYLLLVIPVRRRTVTR